MRRDVLIIGVAALVAIGVGVGVVIFDNDVFQDIPSSVSSSSGTNGQLSAVIVPFTEIARGSSSAISTRVNYHLTSSEQLHDLWETVGATGTPPVVDFKTHSVLAIFAGTEPSSAIAIAKIEDTDTRVVSIVVAKPDAACATKKSATSPYEMVAVPSTTLPLTHKDILATTSCSN